MEEEATVFASGDDGHSAVSAVFVDHSGILSFGSEAERRGAEHPERLVREFAHHLGDGVPLVVGDHAVRAEDLYARMCAWIVESAIDDPSSRTLSSAWASPRRFC